MDTNVCCLCGESMLHCGEYARPNQCPHKFHSMCLQSYVQLMQHSTDCKQCPMEVCKKTYQDILVVDAETHNVKRVIPVRPSPSSQTKDSSPPVKRQRVQSSSSNGLTQTQAECPICTNVLAGEVARPECCDHQFCVSCLLKWAERTHTCPMDRGAFELIFIFTDHVNGVIKKRMKAPPVKKSEEEMEAERLAAEADDIVCRICRRGDNEESLMLCDTCQDAYHIYCLSPPLPRVPDDDWHCDDCAPPSRRPSRLQVAANANRRRRGTDTVATRRRRRPSVDLVSLPSSADDETDSDASQFLVTRSRSRSADALRTRTRAVHRERRPNRPGPSSSRPRRVEPLSDQDSETDSSDEEDGDETEGEERNSFIDDECEEGEEEIDGSESSESDDEDEPDSEADLFLEEAPCSSNYRPRSASAGVVRKRSSRSATSRPKKRRRKTSRPSTKRKSRKSSSRKTTKKGTKRKKRSTSRRKKGRKTSRTKSRGVSQVLRSSLVLPIGGGEPVVGGSRLDVFGRGANGSGLLDSFPHEEMSSENGRMRARRFLLELDSSGEGTTIATGPPARARPPSPNVSFLSGIVAAQKLTYSRHLVADSSTGVLRRVDDCIGGPSKPPTSAPAVPDIRNLGSDKPSSSSTLSTSAPPRANPVPRRTLLILDSDSDSGPASPPHSLLRTQTASATCTTANENRPPPSMHTSHSVTAGPPQWLSSKRSFKQTEAPATNGSTAARSSKTVNEQSASSSSLSKNCEPHSWSVSKSLSSAMATSRPVSKPSEEAEPSSVKRPFKQSEASAANGSTAVRSSKTVNEQSASSSSLSKNCEPHSWAVSKSLSSAMTTSRPVSKPSEETEPSSVKRPSKQSEANVSTAERSSKTVNEQSASLLSLSKNCEPHSWAVSKSLSSAMTTSRPVSKPSEETEPSSVKRPSKQSEASGDNGSNAARSSKTVNEQSASLLSLIKSCEPPSRAVSNSLTSAMTSSCPVLKPSEEVEPSSFKFVSSSQSLNKPSQSTSSSSIFIGSISSARASSNGVASQHSSSRLATEPPAPAMNEVSIGQNIQKNAGRNLLSSQANNRNSDAISQDSQRTTLGIEEESPYFPVPLQTVSRVSSGNLVPNVMSVSSEKSSNFDNRRLHKEEASVCVRYALEKYVVQGQVPEDCVLKLHSRILEKIFKKITSLKKASIESYVKKYVDHWLIMRSCVAGNS